LFILNVRITTDGYEGGGLSFQRSRNDMTEHVRRKHACSIIVGGQFVYRDEKMYKHRGVLPDEIDFVFLKRVLLAIAFFWKFKLSTVTR